MVRYFSRLWRFLQRTFPMATALTAAAMATSSYFPQSWSDLPDELLQFILLRLFCIRDLLSFSSVCRSWRSFATSTIATSPTSLFPPLLLCPIVERRSRRRHHVISSALQLLDPAIPPPTVPPMTLKRSPIDKSILSLPFLCSSHGHLLFLTRSQQILLVNFITGFQITSPVLPFNQHMQPNSLARLTAPLSSPDCCLIILTVDFLLLWRINSLEWSSSRLCVRLSNLSQMLVVGRQIVAVGRRVWALELGNIHAILELPRHLCPKELAVQCPTRDILQCFMDAQLVDSEGEILAVCFTPCIDRISYVEVEVFQFNMFNDHIVLAKKNNLGNRAIFLSGVVNVPGCVCNEPERWGGKNNCIYYAWGANENWCLMEVGGLASRSLINQATRSKCSYPFWDYASVLQ